MSAAVPIGRLRPGLPRGVWTMAEAAFLPVVATFLVAGVAARLASRGQAGDIAWLLATGLAACETRS